MRLLSVVAVVGACRAPEAPPPVPPPADTLAPLVDPRLELLVTPSPDGHAPFVRAIDGAQASIEMTMFHLTDPDVIDALIRAKARGVDVELILDGKMNDKPIGKLAAGGIEAIRSSPAFSITHAKTMIVDHGVAFVPAINLTRDAER